MDAVSEEYISLGRWVNLRGRNESVGPFLILTSQSDDTNPHILLVNQDGDPYFYYGITQLLMSYNRNQRPLALDTTQDISSEEPYITIAAEPELTPEVQEKIEMIFNQATCLPHYRDLFDPKTRTVIFKI